MMVISAHHITQRFSLDFCVFTSNKGYIQQLIGAYYCTMMLITDTKLITITISVLLVSLHKYQTQIRDSERFDSLAVSVLWYKITKKNNQN